MVADHKKWYMALKGLFAQAGVTEIRYKEVVKQASRNASVIPSL